jgi:hypothetical protein
MYNENIHQSVSKEGVVMKRVFLTGPKARVLGVTILLLSFCIACSGQPQALHIEVTEVITSDGEPFNASGPAVDNNLICPSGTVSDVNVSQSGSSQGAFSHFDVLKKFDCADGSGTFDIEMKVKLEDATGNTTASWKLVSGSGNYANLSGEGKLVGTAIVQGTSIFDVYDATTLKDLLNGDLASGRGRCESTK